MSKENLITWLEKLYDEEVELENAMQSAFAKHEHIGAQTVIQEIIKYVRGN